MIKKIISCGDIHIPSLRGIPELEETLSKFCDDCQAIVDKDGRDAVRIVVAGDIFHNKISVTNESIISAGKFFKRLGEICPTIVLAGNHDMLMNNRDRVDSISPLFEIGGYPGVTFIDKGRLLISGYKDDILQSHGILKCDKSELGDIDAEDIVSVRMNTYGAEVMLCNRQSATYKYSGAIIDPASLDDIMLYYVHKEEREWSL